MKLEKTDVHLLFAAGGPKAAAPALPQPAPSEQAAAAPHPADAGTGAGHGTPVARHAGLRAVLRSVLPLLNKKIGTGALGKRERRERLLQLVHWLCQKRGFEFLENVKQPYVFRHARVDGRLQAVVRDAEERVALEVCYELDGAALAKLRSAYLHGAHPVLLWLGPYATAGELSARISQLAGVPSGPWLDLVVLTEGAGQPPK